MSLLLLFRPSSGTPAPPAPPAIAPYTPMGYTNLGLRPLRPRPKEDDEDLKDEAEALMAEIDQLLTDITDGKHLKMMHDEDDWFWLF